MEQWEDDVRVGNWVLDVLRKLVVQVYWKERMSGFGMGISITVSEFEWRFGEIYNVGRPRSVGAPQVQREDFWVPGTVGTAWRHPIGRQAPHQRCVVFWSWKMLFFVLFAQQEPSSGSLVPPGATFLIFGHWAPPFFLVCIIFVKLQFPVR